MPLRVVIPPRPSAVFGEGTGQKGSLSLIDQRQGQKSKVTPEVLAELIYQVCTRIAEGIPFSSEDIWAALNERFPEKKISPRTVRYHIKPTGIPPGENKLKSATTRLNR